MAVFVNRWSVYEKMEEGGGVRGQGSGCKHGFWKQPNLDVQSGRDTLSQPGQTSSLHHQHRSGRLLSCMQTRQADQSTSCQLIKIFSRQTAQTSCHASSRDLRFKVYVHGRFLIQLLNSKSAAGPIQ